MCWGLDPGPGNGRAQARTFGIRCNVVVRATAGDTGRCRTLRYTLILLLSVTPRGETFMTSGVDCGVGSSRSDGTDFGCPSHLRSGPASFARCSAPPGQILIWEQCAANSLLRPITPPPSMGGWVGGQSTRTG